MSARGTPRRLAREHSDEYERITQWHVSQYAYLASKLDSMPEGDGTVLDNSCLMFLSNLWIGRKHDNTRLPLVLAGGLGGTLETGRTLDYVKPATRTGRRAACISRSWIGWGSSSIGSATPTRASPGYRWIVVANGPPSLPGSALGQSFDANTTQAKY